MPLKINIIAAEIKRKTITGLEGKPVNTLESRIEKARVWIREKTSEKGLYVQHQNKGVPRMKDRETGEKKYSEPNHV